VGRRREEGQTLRAKRFGAISGTHLARVYTVPKATRQRYVDAPKKLRKRATLKVSFNKLALFRSQL